MQEATRAEARLPLISGYNVRRRELVRLQSFLYGYSLLDCSNNGELLATSRLSAADRPQVSASKRAAAAESSVGDQADLLHYSRYSILGFLSSGTYGRVYKARIRKPSSDMSPAGLMGTPGAATPGKRLKLTRDDGDDDGELVAIKKFKPDKEGEAITYTGISQSACREIMVSSMVLVSSRRSPR